MRKYIFSILFCFILVKAFASHISGGEIFYTYIGKSPNDTNKLVYKITLLLYKDTTVTGPNVANLNGAYNVTIYKGSDNSFVSTITLPRVSYDFLKLTTYNPCLTTRPRVEFSVAAYEAEVTLDPLNEGYLVSHSQCCRVATVININSFEVGATYWVKIPGLSENPFAPNNSSAFFNRKDTILICKSGVLNIDFSATDIDKDSLVYSLTTGYDGAVRSTPLPNQSDAPPYRTVSYNSGFSFSDPFGTNIRIDSKTGLVTGNSPANPGIYLIAVKVEEYRNGRKISEHMKEFQIKVEDCTLSAASLKPSYINCNDFTFTFFNESAATNIISYNWNFGDANTPTNTSTSPTPIHTYSDTGTFRLQLKVVSSIGCVDSAISLVRVFPGFTADFTLNSSCILNPYAFSDATFTRYGAVDSWKWNLGQNNTTDDEFTIKNPSYIYPTSGTKTVSLIATNTKGCVDTVTKTITVFDRPALQLPFKDTLICSIDTLPLIANGTGVFTWTPNSFITRTNISNPLVFPKDTTTYYVTILENGCTTTDSIRVNVLDFIEVNAGLDTGICRTDTIQLKPVSFALGYNWTSSSGEVVQATKFPFVRPLVNTTYFVRANLGKCEDRDTVSVKVTPYPGITVSNDTAVCFGNRTTLQANIVGSSFSWSPTSSLINANTLSPTAGPVNTTSYVLTVFDTIGCPKPSRDTVLVRVIPIVKVNAGRDTFVVINQPLQLAATSTVDLPTTLYRWTPSIGLNNTNIADPIATLNSSVDSVRYVVRTTTREGCFGEDNILVTVFKSEPDIFVPTGFTPNADGKNDIVKPIPVGIVSFNYFNIYNRWGQLIYTTKEVGKGWDGTFNGIAQPSGAYIFTTQGTSFLGKQIFKKGTVVLIR